jgi:hypothetical protein
VRQQSSSTNRNAAPADALAMVAFTSALAAVPDAFRELDGRDPLLP